MFMNNKKKNKKRRQREIMIEMEQLKFCNRNTISILNSALANERKRI